MNIQTETGSKTKTYIDALMIRKTVFVDEQSVPLDLEVDAYDPVAINYVGYLNQQPTTTARIITADNNGWHVQRVATLAEFRHQHLASELLQQIAVDAKAAKITYLILDAQVAAIPFYQQLGYQLTAREQFLDAGIWHREMIFEV